MYTTDNLPSPSKLPNLIGIHGHAGSGKDTVAEFISTTYKDHYIESLAGPLKNAAAAAFGVARELFDSPELKEQNIPFWGVSPRKIAQFLGTEMFRDCTPKLIPDIESNFWISRLELRLTNQYEPDDEGSYESHHTVIIPDVRFQNEYNWVVDNGGIIIHLTRPGADGTVGIPSHQSEASIDLNTKERTYECENNGTLTELHRKIANILIAAKY